MPEFRLTQQADRDLLDIFIYGLEVFGIRQAEHYGDDLHSCFQLLADNPRMGRLAPALGEQVRRHEHHSHVILYEEASFGILILAIIHSRVVQRMKAL
ncbi:MULTISPECIES: type II toxin-antitoxin system RelE/ParE family toxin [Pseudorhizobium]|uniref:type II toxin-antitoxin system RelE/ParE family toxin n=1 Tax=Pseudorhizobium TaxID=1903858 RepID=UPI0004953033|nr:type II toxin-antitoxin system RelE/ParE family toxin [Pseudorhizobium marinum]